MVARSKKNSASVAAISLEGSLIGCIEPVIAILDKDHPVELGHEAPSRKDGMLRVLINNFCRDTYQQIYGVKTDTYNFNGVKDNWDRAQNALAQLEAKYRNAPEDLDADPNTLRYLAWYEQAEAKYHMLTSMLADFQSVYKTVTGDDWVYQAPGSRSKGAPISGADAAKTIREKLAAKMAATKAAREQAAIEAAPINQAVA